MFFLFEKFLLFRENRYLRDTRERLELYTFFIEKGVIRGQPQVTTEKM